MTLRYLHSFLHFELVQASYKSPWAIFGQFQSFPQGNVLRIVPLTHA